jgi:hypothetical protein
MFKKLFRVVLREQVALLADAEDEGLRGRNDPVLGWARPQCDLCKDHPEVGRLLSSPWAYVEVKRGGIWVFKRERAPDGRPVLYWVCFPCADGLRQDREALLRRLEQVYGVSEK